MKDTSEEEEEDMDLSTVSIPMVVSPSHQHVVHEECDVQTHIKYLNYTGKHIDIGFRSGLIIPVPPRTHRMRSQFVIRYEHNFNDNVRDRIRDFIVSHEGETSADFRAFKDLFMRAFKEQSHGLRMKLDYEVPLSLLTENRGCVYVSEIDIILSTRQDVVPLHPFCYESLVRQPTPNSRTHSTGLIVHIVDNHGRIGERYIRLHDKVVKVKSERNALKPNGLYIEFIGVVNSSREDDANIVRFTPENELDDLPWLFTSYAHARLSDDKDAELNLELRNTDVEVRRLDVESKKLAASSAVQRSALEADKMALEQRKLELEGQNLLLQDRLTQQERRTKAVEDALKREHAQREHESKLQQLHSKDYYEERSAQRKDTSEWVKFLPVIVGLTGAAFFGFKNWFDTK